MASGDFSGSSRDGSCSDTEGPGMGTSSPSVSDSCHLCKLLEVLLNPKSRPPVLTGEA